MKKLDGRLKVIRDKVHSSLTRQEVMKCFDLSFEDIAVFDGKSGEILQAGNSDVWVIYFSNENIQISTPL